MTKSRKIWLLVFIAMFLVPEILFSPLPSFFSFMLGYDNFPSLAVKIFPENFLEANAIIIDIFLSIEYLGLLCLFVWNIKFNNSKIYKWITAVFLGLAIIALSFTFALMYAISHLSFP